MRKKDQKLKERRSKSGTWKNHLFITIFFVLFFTLNALSQSKSVSGKNGEAIPGATIVVKGTNQGTISDMNGNFSINIPSGSNIYSRQICRL